MIDEYDLEKKMNGFNFIRMSEEDEMYILQLNKHVFLLAQGKQNQLGSYHYDFYKQIYIQDSSRIYYYAKNLTEKQLISRVSNYYESKKAILLKQLENRQPRKSRKEMLHELREKKKEEATDKKWIQMTLNLSEKKGVNIL